MSSSRHRGRHFAATTLGAKKLPRLRGRRAEINRTDPGEPFHAFLETLGIPSEDRIIRALARRGVADRGIELTVETLIPEVTITATGVYWHPVGAEHADQLVTRDIFPLQKAITQAIDKFTEYRADAVSAAQWFSCA
jgi:hypothetical protein